MIAGADLFSVAGSVEPLEERPRKRCALQKAEPVFRVNRKRERHGRGSATRTRSSRTTSTRWLTRLDFFVRFNDQHGGRNESGPPAPPPTGVGERRDREGIAFSSEAEPDLSHISPHACKRPPKQPRIGANALVD